MRTQIYEHRSGLKVVPNVIVADVEKIIWDILNFDIDKTCDKL